MKFLLRVELLFCFHSYRGHVIFKKVREIVLLLLQRQFTPEINQKETTNVLETRIKTAAKRCMKNLKC